MSQSAGTTQWELGHKLACHCAALSLVTWCQSGLLIGQSTSLSEAQGVFHGNVIPCPKIPDSLLGQFTAQFLQTFPKRCDTK